MKKINVLMFTVLFALTAAACDRSPLRIRANTVVSDGASETAVDTSSATATKSDIASTTQTATGTSTVATATATATETVIVTATHTETATATQTVATSTDTGVKTQSDTGSATATQTSSATATSYLDMPGCTLWQTLDLSTSGSRVGPLTVATNGGGSEVAVFDAATNTVVVSLYALLGRPLKSYSIPVAVPATLSSGVKMVGGINDDVVIAIPTSSPSADNGWLSDYDIYHVTMSDITLVAQPKGVKSLALVSDGAYGFYSLELMPNQGFSTVYCDDSSSKTTDVSAVSVRPLLSAVKSGWAVSGQFDYIADAAMVGAELKMLLWGGALDCTKSYSIAQIISETVLDNGQYLAFDSKSPSPFSIVKDKPESVLAWSLLASQNVTGMFWADETDTGNGGYTRSFHISVWDGQGKLSETPGDPTYVTDRSAVLGWNDNIVQVIEGWDTDPSQVSLNVGKGDGTWQSYKLYEHDKGKYVKSFAGKDKHFVILDGIDMVDGTYGAWASFVYCN